MGATETWGSELLTNGDFEDWAADEPDGWTDYQGDSAEETTEVQSGNSSNKFTVESGKSNGSVYQDVTVVADQWYRAEVWVKNGNADAIRLRLHDPSWNWQFNSPPVTPSTWQLLVVYFKPTTTSARFDVQVDGDSKYAYIDSARCLQVTYDSDPVTPSHIGVGFKKSSIDDYTDDFSDNVIDHRWNFLLKGTGEVTEQNDRLECYCPANGDHAGLVSQNRYNLSNASLEVDCDLGTGYDGVILLSMVQTFDATWGDNWYAFYKRRSDSKWYIYRKVDGTQTELANGSYTADDSKLKIEISNGVISFYEGGEGKYSETYALSSYDLYIYIYHYAVTGYLGTVYFDDLSFSCTDSLKGNTVLASEMARSPLSIKETWANYQIRLNAEFQRGTATGTWYEIGLFNADEIMHLLDDCGDDTDWATGVSNSLTLEVSDYREGTACLEAIGPSGLRFQRLTIPGPTGDEDNFNDNTLDTDYWEKLEVGSGSVAEQNEQLECTTSASGDYAGVVTKSAHDTTICEIGIEASGPDNKNHERVLMICLTKTTNSDPYGEDDWYRIFKEKSTGKTVIQRRTNGGTPSTLYSDTWQSAGGPLRIRVKDGNIRFYDEGVDLYNETYQLSSYECYVYMYVYGYDTNTGMDYFDDYNTSLNPTINGESYLQLFYYVSDWDLVSDATPLIRVGNDTSNYWQWDLDWNFFQTGWQWISLRFTDCTTVSGDPTFSIPIHIFRLGLGGGASIDEEFFDRIDYIRLFRENGDMYCRAELDVGTFKGLNEIKHVLWRLTVTS